MKSINQQLAIGIIASALLVAGCTTKTQTVSSTKKSDKKAALLPPKQTMERIDLSTLKPLTPESSKEEVFTYATALITNGRFEEAEAHLTKLTEEHPELAGPHINLAISYFQSEQYDKAASSFTKSLELKPNNALAHDYLARIDREKGSFDTALEHYLKAIEVDPTYAPAQRNIGILYDLYLNQPAKALGHYQKYQTLISEADKHVAIWIRDLTNRTKAAQNTTNDDSEE